MFGGFSEKAVDYLWELRMNNNKPWFDEHKQEYETLLKKPMSELCNSIFAELISESKSLELMKTSVSRIQKDARFSHAFPYRDNYWFTFKSAREDWWVMPAYYFELAPESFSWGMGMWSAAPSLMAKFRKSIDLKPEKLEAIASVIEGSGRFAIEGDFYKKSKGEHPQSLEQWYNRRSFSVNSVHTYEDKLAFTPKLEEEIKRDFRTLFALYDYIDEVFNSGIYD